MTKLIGYQIAARWTAERAVGVAAVLAFAGALGLSLEMAGQDVIHLYVRSPVTDFYRLYLDTGAGFADREFMSNTFFPTDPADSGPRVNFPLPPQTQGLRIALGEQPGSVIPIVRLCIERSLFVSRCLDGGNLAQYVVRTQEATAAANGNELSVHSSGYRPSVVFGKWLLEVLRPPVDASLFVVRLAIFIAAAAFFFCFFLALLRPMAAWWTRDALLLFAIAAALRALLFALFRPSTVSDSFLYLTYLQSDLFETPGLRGITYPAFLTLFGAHRDALFTVQFLLGAAGSVIVLLLLRSLKRPSRWDLLWALVATSVPALLAMESLILAESLSLFLILVALLIFRWLQANPPSAISTAGLGAACALLAHTKPQFGFMAVLLAAILVIPRFWPKPDWRQSVQRLAAFGAPVLALQFLALTLNFSYGNFRGTSSTLGYSLFDHGQQSIVCPTTSSDPHIRYYCEAQAALPPHGDPYGYTAWVMFPTMHRLQEPFYRATKDYEELSVRLIAQHPRLYVRTVWNSFVGFWTGEIPMVRHFLIFGDRDHPALHNFMTKLARVDRLFRDAIELAFFLLIVAAAFRRIPPNRDDILFGALMVTIVMASSILQALVESGRENPRFETPTEPLLTITIVYLVARLRAGQEYKPAVFAASSAFRIDRNGTVR
jgi:hypothetical protein